MQDLRDHVCSIFEAYRSMAFHVLKEGEGMRLFERERARERVCMCMCVFVCVCVCVCVCVYVTPNTCLQLQRAWRSRGITGSGSK